MATDTAINEREITCFVVGVSGRWFDLIVRHGGYKWLFQVATDEGSLRDGQALLVALRSQVTHRLPFIMDEATSGHRPKAIRAGESIFNCYNIRTITGI